jgi:hypothetical protein
VRPQLTHPLDYIADYDALFVPKPLCSPSNPFNCLGVPYNPSNHHVLFPFPAIAFVFRVLRPNLGMAMSTQSI